MCLSEVKYFVHDCCKESDIPALSHIGSSAERYRILMNVISVVNSACDAYQKRPCSISSKAGFLTAALPESSSQGASTDLQSAFNLLLNRMDKIESNISSVTRTNNLLHERTTVQ